MAVGPEVSTRGGGLIARASPSTLCSPTGDAYQGKKRHRGNVALVVVHGGDDARFYALDENTKSRLMSYACKHCTQWCSDK
uniref:Uncharacterized protein n=1 Tax=Oryza nivara TaxID=4536 RepID=A0A0E0HLA2_ORYNI